MSPSAELITRSTNNSALINNCGSIIRSLSWDPLYLPGCQVIKWPKNSGLEVRNAHELGSGCGSHELNWRFHTAYPSINWPCKQWRYTWDPLTFKPSKCSMECWADPQRNFLSSTIWSSAASLNPYWATSDQISFILVTTSHSAVLCPIKGRTHGWILLIEVQGLET